jgi:hypothetical protein
MVLRRRAMPAGVGLFLFIAAFVVLWINEGAAVREYTSIKELARVAVPADVRERDAALDGQAVILSGGRAAPVSPVVDPLFGLEVAALRVKRTVEMYQWSEHSGDRGTSEISYALDWEEKPIDSSGFRREVGHANPPFPFTSESIDALEVTYGAGYRLSSGLLKRITGFEPLDPRGLTAPDGYEGQAMGQSFYLSEDPGNPQPGDIRVRYEWVRPQNYSLIALQRDSLLDLYTTRSGHSYAIVRAGQMDGRELIASANDFVRLRTLFIRGLGIVMLVFGLKILIERMTGVFRRLPVIGGAIDLGALLVAGVLGGALALMTIALAWLAYRPLLSVGLLVAAGVALEFLVLRKRRFQKVGGLHDTAQEARDAESDDSATDAV